VTNKMYIAFAQGFEKFNRLLVFSYATGQELIAADLHIVPCLHHTLWGAGKMESRILRLWKGYMARRCLV
jgi:hypothetical protein